MRPRVFPAEDSPGPPRLPSPSECFNEAAGIPRGRRWKSVSSRTIPSCFNEAAGIPRGRRWGESDPILVRVASMRPRVFPAEDADTMIVPLPSCSRLQ